MSFLQKPGGGIAGTAVDPVGPGSVLIDPTLEITQPGGPFPYGYSILTDGAGAYVIAPTLRPYILGFSVAGGVPDGGTRYMDYQNVATSFVGVVLPLATNLIAITVAVDVIDANTYDVEIVSDPTGAPVVLGTLTLDPGERTDYRRDLSVAIPAGTELGARLVRTVGAGASAFGAVAVSIELET